MDDLEAVSRVGRWGVGMSSVDTSCLMVYLYYEGSLSSFGDVRLEGSFVIVSVAELRCAVWRGGGRYDCRQTYWDPKRDHYKVICWLLLLMPLVQGTLLLLFFRACCRGVF